MILKNLLAVILALVIANPACCCAFKPHAQEASHSCCSEKSDPSQKKNDKHCSCSSFQEKAAPETDLFKADPGSTQLLTQLTVSTESFLPKLSEAAGFLAKWPPGQLPVATMQTRLAGKCAYLI